MSAPAAEREPAEKQNARFWFLLTLALAAIYGLVLLARSWGEFTIQDDARQHVFWLRRFLDPGLFPNDLIADYFQSVSPPGYTAVYWLAAKAGIDPVLFSKVVSLLLLVVTAGYFFAVSMQITPSPLAAFIGAHLFIQVLATNENLPSATTRAFLSPLFIAFLFYLLRGSLIPCLASLALLGLFYPQVLMVAAGVLALRLLRWEGGPRLSRERRDWLFAVTGIGVSGAVLLPFALQTSQYGPVITPDQARVLPEFGAEGRSDFFSSNPLMFWVFGRRSGIFPPAFHSPLLWAGFALPFLFRGPLRDRLPPTRAFAPLLQVTLASAALYFVAHALLFRLHLPSRYTQHTLPVVIALAAGPVLAVWWQMLGPRAVETAAGNSTKSPPTSVRAGGLRAVDCPRIHSPGQLALAGVFLFLPFLLLPVWNDRYHTGAHPDLYRFVASQPKDVRIATLSAEGDDLPSFARRSVLGAREYAIPYHMGYYNRFRERMADLVRAQYTADPAELRAVIERHGIDYFVLDQGAFRPEYLSENEYLMQFQPHAAEALERLRRGERPALEQAAARAEVFRTGGVVVLDASRIVHP